jgi:hypothetical protein
MQTRFTAVWQVRDGRWQALCHHATAPGADARYAGSSVWPASR